MVKLIALDDGHGINTAGKRTPILPTGMKSELGRNYMNENLFNRAVVKYLNLHLKASGFKTILVAPTDEDTPLATRVKRANDAKADLYVSVHANALTSKKWGTHGGTETYVYKGSKESERIGKIIHKWLMKGTPLRDRGVKEGNHLYVIRNTKMPAVLVECAFMDNLEEAKLLLSDAFRKECAKEIAQGICEAYGVKFKDGVGGTSSSGSKANNSSNGSSTDKLYRIRKTWGDAKSQKGAYKDLNNAKKLANSLKSQGYKVFDWNGKVVYDPNPQKTKEDDNKWYRVRKSWSNSKSQIGAFKDLNGAKDLADLHAKEGYKVFDWNGKVVYEPKVLKENQYYRVRLEWSKPQTQVGAYKELKNAKAMADSLAHEGYKVFDDNGKVVYTPKIKESTVIHTVVKGDTLWSISQKYEVTVDDIKKKNGLKNDTIHVGQKLIIKGDAPKKQDEKKEEQPKEQSKPKEDEHKGHNNITGKSVVSAEKMSAFVKSKNPNAKDIDRIAKAFIEVGNKYNIRGDIAFCQSIIETGWFKFNDGTAVTPDQHNYCGLGVTSKGVEGHSFDTIEEGVTAQIQHLFAYATKNDLPKGEELVDPRFQYVTRGVAPHWEDLNMKWAMNDNYGQHIMSIYDQLNKFEYSPPVEEPEEEKEANPSDDLPKEDNKDEQDLEEEKQFKFWTRVIDYLIDKLAKLFGIKKK